MDKVGDRKAVAHRSLEKSHDGTLTQREILGARSRRMGSLERGLTIHCDDDAYFLQRSLLCPGTRVRTAESSEMRSAARFGAKRIRAQPFEPTFSGTDPKRLTSTGSERRKV